MGLSITKDKIVINIVKHPVEGVKSWEWVLIDTWKYDCILTSSHHHLSEQEARQAWIDFAKLNNISNWEWYSDKPGLQDIRTGSGALI